MLKKSFGGKIFASKLVINLKITRKTNIRRGLQKKWKIDGTNEFAQKNFYPKWHGVFKLTSYYKKFCKHSLIKSVRFSTLSYAYRHHLLQMSLEVCNCKPWCFCKNILNSPWKRIERCDSFYGLPSVLRKWRKFLCSINAFAECRPYGRK